MDKNRRVAFVAIFIVLFGSPLVAKTTLPSMVVVFRHCEKLTPCKKKFSDEFPSCCVANGEPPNSCDDCSPQGYRRAQGLPASMEKLLTAVAPSQKLQSIYAAGSKEMNKRCSSSRRMSELVVPLSATQELAVNTDFCWGQEKDLAREILKNRAGQIVAISWEHSNIPLLIGWLLALGENEKATAPKKVGKWHEEIFDQYWIVDFRGASPKLVREPHQILNTDCPIVRDEKGRCPTKDQPPR